MNSTVLLKYANTPLKQISNRVWRTYTGGALIDRWKQISPEIDDNLPEEWIMSTISARGLNRPPGEGLSEVGTSEGAMKLNRLIEGNPELFLGERVARKYGTTGVLIKILDSAERLTIQVHPDKIFAREMLGSVFGKTESWYILGGREIHGEKSSIYLGFKEGVTEELWKELFLKQEIQEMLNSLHRFEVKPGDAFIIYGGVPHAIGSGCFLMEVQEPTDYTMRVEKVTPGGLTISDELIHQGIGIEKMLKCFHYEGCSFENAMRKWKIIPEVISTSGEHTLKSIFNKSHTDCFALNELDLKGEFAIKGNGDYFIGVIYSGEGKIISGKVEIPYSQGDEFFFPAAIQTVWLKASATSKIMLCYPPG
jgi:mannose-6-phosphate isomerase